MSNTFAERLTMESHIVKIRLTDADLDSLHYLSEMSGSTRNETIRQALAISKYVNINLQEGNSILLLKGENVFELQFGDQNKIQLYPPKQKLKPKNIFKNLLNIFKLKA